MHLLLTGVSGFIGRNLLRHIVEYHSDVVKRITAITKDQTKHQGIIHYVSSGNYDRPDFSTADFKSVDCILHLGSFTPKTFASSNHVDECLSNIIFTNELLKNVSPGQKKIVFVSTLDVYASCTVPLDEQSPLNPQSLYAASKLYCEAQLQAVCNSQNIPWTILRLGHIYGPGEEAYQKIIPSTIKNILTNNPVRLFTSGEEVRSFLYVEDCCRMIWKSFEANSDFRIVNVAGKNSFKIEEIMERIILLSKEKVIIQREFNPGIKSRDITFNTALCNTLLGEEEVSIDQGLRTEMDYFRNLFST